MFAVLHDLNIGVQGKENSDSLWLTPKSGLEMHFSTLHSGYLVLL